MHPCITKHEDQENNLVALECVGLICVLDCDVFLNYSSIFNNILAEDIMDGDRDNKRAKVIAIKSVVDGLIIHGIEDDRLAQFFDILTNQYLNIRNRILR